jgi:hypothetical protein
MSRAGPASEGQGNRLNRKDLLPLMPLRDQQPRALPAVLLLPPHGRPGAKKTHSAATFCVSGPSWR